MLYAFVEHGHRWKVGMTNDFDRRRAEWDRQCPSSTRIWLPPVAVKRRRRAECLAHLLLEIDCADRPKVYCFQSQTIYQGRKIHVEVFRFTSNRSIVWTTIVHPLLLKAAGAIKHSARKKHTTNMDESIRYVVAMTVACAPSQFQRNWRSTHSTNILVDGLKASSQCVLGNQEFGYLIGTDDSSCTTQNITDLCSPILASVQYLESRQRHYYFGIDFGIMEHAVHVMEHEVCIVEQEVCLVEQEVGIVEQEVGIVEQESRSSEDKSMREKSVLVRSCNTKVAIYAPFVHLILDGYHESIVEVLKKVELRSRTHIFGSNSMVKVRNRVKAENRIRTESECTDRYVACQASWNDYVWESWNDHCQLVSSPSSRLVDALEELNISELLTAASMRPNTNVATIRTIVFRLKSIVQWAEELGRSGKQDTSISTALPSRYREFKEKFRIQIPSHLGAAEREELRLAILVLKYDLCLYKPDMLDIISALMNRHLNPEEVSRILHSPCPNLVPTLDPTVTNAVDISFPNCHKEILFQILHINRTPSSLYVPDTIDYANSQWINHLVETVPDPKNVKILFKNVSSLQTYEDVQKARAWIENIEDSASRNESVRAFMKQRRVSKLMDGVHVSQSSTGRPRRRICGWLTFRVCLRYHISVLYLEAIENTIMVIIKIVAVLFLQMQYCSGFAGSYRQDSTYTKRHSMRNE
ncbi:hypothetical protein EV361DRAFT_873926 [Lentinula raphanica]|nr:hypothetical protein EV361DRAFT_873926 [Lentinula raphanica]